MKYVLLSADNNPSVYTVPDIVVENLSTYCMEFCTNWLHESPHAEKYRIGCGVCYNEKDFIEYLNEWIFPDNHSKFIETIDLIDSNADIPKKYFGCERFNF